MHILVVTKYPWDDVFASGNTLTNFFSEWENTVISTVYCREASPNNNCCSDYFVVSPTNIVKNLFTPWKIGYSFSTTESNNKKESATLEKSLTLFSKKHKVVPIIYDMIYSTRVWLNRKIKKYVNDTRPDIVFTFGTPDAFNYYLIKFIKKKYNIPVVTYFVDNHFKHSINIYYLIHNKRLKNLAKLSNKCYAITELMCDEYSNKMHKEFNLLYKGCEKSVITPKCNNPTRIIYAGNLFYGRDKVLELLSSVLISCNKNSNNACLDIYTASIPDREFKNNIVRDNVATLHAPEPYSNIKRIMRDSDIVLHVESFEKEQMDLVRLSFSTKITDCLQSGAMVMAIGPSNLASISFLSKIPGVVVITDLDEIPNMVKDLLSNPTLVKEKAAATSEFANMYLGIDLTREMLKKDFCELIQLNNDRS